jgi:protein-S-isoprenylcysteine O-methyltransferase Ste14
VDLSRILHALPAIVFAWMVVGAVVVFTRDVGGRSPRGVGIAVSMWGSLAATSHAMTPPPWVSAVGAMGLLGALSLYHWAAFSIRGRTFSYAGNQDLPQFVHQSGPYRYIRNPFYASYLLAELFTTVMWPSIWGALVVVLAMVYFEWLGRFEEGKFAQSEVAEEYARYKARTGRLFPRVF